MASVYDIIKGINQAAANAYDGSQYKRYSYDGEEKKIGLRREEGDPIIDSRVMDGFSVRISGDQLILSYHSELPMKEVHEGGFEDDVERKFKSISKFLKGEYKKITKDTLSLTPKGDAEVLVQSMSNLRSWVQATKLYKIGGLKGVEAVGQGTPEDRLTDSIKDWLALGKSKSKNFK